MGRQRRQITQEKRKGNLPPQSWNVISQLYSSQKEIQFRCTTEPFVSQSHQPSSHDTT